MKMQNNRLIKRSDGLDCRPITPGPELDLTEFMERAEQLYWVKYDMHNWSQLLDPNRPAVPPVIPKGRPSTRDVVGSILTANG